MAMGSGKYRRWGCAGAAERPPVRPVGVVGLGGGAGLAAGAVAAGGTLTTTGAVGVVGFGAAGWGAIAIWGPLRVNCAALQVPKQPVTHAVAQIQNFDPVKVVVEQQTKTAHRIRFDAAAQSITSCTLMTCRIGDSQQTLLLPACKVSAL